MTANIENLATISSVPVGTEAGLPVRHVGSQKVGDGTGGHDLQMQNAEPPVGTYALPVQQVPIPSTPVRLTALVGAAQTIKGAAGRLLGLIVINDSAAAAYVQIFDHAAPTVGTTVPVIELKVAAGASLQLWFGDVGIAFAAAIKVASTTTSGGAVGSAAGVQVSAQFK